METVAFYSYKGGVGRTLLVANTAQFLAMSGRRVVALDLDLEAPGLHQKLGTPEILTRAQAGTLHGAVDDLLATLSEEPSMRPALQSAVVKIDLPLGTKGSLMLIPAGSAPSHHYWECLDALNHALRNVQTGNGGLVEAILDLQARIQKELEPEFLLVDSRTGITELGGLATSILADRVVCLTTTAAESIDGTRVVANALRTAPRLSSQRPLRIDFLITRVPAGSVDSPLVTGLKKELGDRVGVLPHDSGIATEEQVLSGWRPVNVERNRTDDASDAGRRLFSYTLDWIAASFPGHEQEAEVAKHRMQEIQEAWQYLTRTSERIGGGVGSRAAWPLDQLRERVRFEKGKKSRQADIVVYERPSTDSASDPLMIIEYVEREDRDAVAHWWLSNTVAKVVAILSYASDGVSQRWDRRLYSRRNAWDSRAKHSDRWDLPLPHDFNALTDPTDVSVDSLLDAVRRGHAEYLDRLISEWVRSSASGLHGGAPWKPEVAKKIVDGLARVDDIELARRVLWASSLGHGHRRGMWLGDGDEYLDEQVIAELFSPLLWRLPAEASIDLMVGRGRPFGPPSGMMALAILARELLGLDYDPDAHFRREGHAIFERSSSDGEDSDRGLYGLCPAFRHTEISFKISSERPPVAAIEIDEGDDDRGDRRTRREFVDVGQIVADRISSGSLITTGLLGNYDPNIGRVTLFREAIDECAEKLALRSRHVGSLTLIHETIHALMHVGRDLDRRMWPEFNLPRADRPLFEPSLFHEAITQYFTYKHVVRLGDATLLHAFETMAKRQAPAYRAWQRFRHMPIEDVRNWFMSVRRGTAGMPIGFPSSLLHESLRED